MRIQARHTLGDLVTDLAGMGPGLYREGGRIIRQNVSEGGKTARRIARWKSGPHGSAYWKRITWDRSASSFQGFDSGALQGEYGVNGGGVPVGAGFRHGGPNTDLDESLDLIRPKFHRDVDSLIDGLFW